MVRTLTNTIPKNVIIEGKVMNTKKTRIKTYCKTTVEA